MFSLAKRTMRQYTHCCTNTNVNKDILHTHTQTHVHTQKVDRKREMGIKGLVKNEVLSNKLAFIKAANTNFL